jgi:hypothetical protein
MPNIGDRVLARWPQEKEWWYPGVVCATHGAELEVQYDDGDRAVVHADLARPLDLQPGARIHCRYQGGPTFYPGRVAGAVGSAIQINYDDGDKETSSVSMVRINSSDLG